MSEQPTAYNDILNLTAETADTEGTQINAAETRRVVSVFFDRLAELNISEALSVIGTALEHAQDRSEEKEEETRDSCESEDQSSEA